MSLLAAVAGSLGQIGAVTVNADWGSDSGASPLASADRTLTVPAGNPGSLKFDLGEGGGSWEYRKNSGSWTSFTDNDDVTFANGDTLGFRLTIGEPGADSVNVLDNLRGDGVGSFEGEIT